MLRWIAFDAETAEVVVSRFRRGAAEIHSGEPLAAALKLGRPSFMILPSDLPNRVLVARVEPKTEIIAAEPVTFNLPVPSAEGDPGATPKAPQSVGAKKKWWQRKTA